MRRYVFTLEALSSQPAYRGVAMSQLTSQLLGSWRMTSWTFEVLETGEVKDALGKNPRGYVNYSPDGRVMVLVLHEDRPMPKALVPTSEEKSVSTIRCLPMQEPIRLKTTGSFIRSI